MKWVVLFFASCLFTLSSGYIINVPFKEYYVTKMKEEGGEFFLRGQEIGGITWVYVNVNEFPYRAVGHQDDVVYEALCKKGTCDVHKTNETLAPYISRRHGRSLPKIEGTCTCSYDDPCTEYLRSGEGRYVVNGSTIGYDHNTCYTCNTGKYQTHATFEENKNSCNDCPTGYYQDEEGQNYCKEN